ncbi:diaminopimelate epimerase [Halobacillus kuroshimensis]|uniref:diaminopimelate epimerase n=1 Tax=Halobacillus kuroshimensis TaxID=302481 RepID=UPI000404B4D9|nr:diaminopimelate epimerase [Halobacillus kuroshimensis]
MKHEVEFMKFNPTQNMTILIDTPYPIEKHKTVSSEIMSYQNVYAEQVGFIEKPFNTNAEARLQMAGGEFCGNACMALALLVSSQRNLLKNGCTKFSLEVSGSDRLIQCQVKQDAHNFYCKVDMPLPKKIELKQIIFEGNELEIIIVRYDGFLHIIFETDEFNAEQKKRAQSLAELLGATLEVNLIGILLYKRKTHELSPLIYIPDLDSSVWERGCGSGTASLGAYLAWKHNKDIVSEIKQPGGTITVACHHEEGERTKLTIEGTVDLVAVGKAFIDV